MTAVLFHAASAAIASIGFVLLVIHV